MNKESNYRLDIIEYGKKLVDNNLIQATWGNISIRLDDQYFLITPSGMSYYDLKEEDIVKVKIDDLSYQGKNKPSSEKAMHAYIYQERNDIGAIIHTHSSNIQVLSACRKGIGDYPCAMYGISSTDKLARNVAKVFKKHDGAVMANHGFVVGKKTIEDAFKEAFDWENKAGEVIGNDI